MIRLGLIGTEIDYGPATSRLQNVTLVPDGNECDAVVIHSEAPDREERWRQAINDGKHLLVEMPIASTREMGESLVQSCQESGLHLMAGNAKRFLPSVQAVKEVLSAGKLGQPGLIRIHDWATNDTKNQSLLARLISEVDLAVWLFGARPTEIYAAGRVEDHHYVQVHLGFPEGGMAMIDSAVLPTSKPYYSVSLIGSTGAAYADDHHNAQLLYQTDQPTALTTPQSNHHRIAQLQAFADAIAQNVEPPITGQEGCLALEITELALESLKTTKPAHLKGESYELV